MLCHRKKKKETWPYLLLIIFSDASSRVWNALTDNYGNVMAVDWKTSHTRSLHLPTLNLTEHEVLHTHTLTQRRCLRLFFECHLAGEESSVNTLLPCPQSAKLPVHSLIQLLSFWRAEVGQPVSGSVGRRGAEGADGHALDHRFNNQRRAALHSWAGTFSHSQRYLLHWPGCLQRHYLENLSENIE